MRVANYTDRELLQPRFERFQLRVCRLERGVKSRLIAFVERREINRLHGGIQLLLALPFPVFVSRDDGPGCENLGSQSLQVRTCWRRLDH